MVELREGPPYCGPGLMTIVLRDRIEDPVLKVAGAAQARDGKLLSELLGFGLNCSAAVLGWVVVAGSAGAAPITGGASTFLTYVSLGAAAASSVGCVNAVGRVAAEIYSPEDLDIWTAKVGTRRRHWSWMASPCLVRSARLQLRSEWR